MGLLAAELTLLVVVVLLVAAVVSVYGRRRLISHNSDVVLSGFRSVGVSRWRPGLLRMSAHDLSWYPLFGWTPRPRHTWPRRTLEVTASAPLEHDRGLTSLIENNGVRVPTSGRTEGGRHMEFELALGRSSYTALRYWVEASPPPGLPVDH